MKQETFVHEVEECVQLNIKEKEEFFNFVNGEIKEQIKSKLTNKSIEF
jgi:hypothetical protein